ncbi:MAG: hypothetical protein ACF8NJ_07645 [Phycisphaerales bacterium JB038]
MAATKTTPRRNPRIEAVLTKTLPMLLRWVPQHERRSEAEREVEAQPYAARLAYRLDQALRQRRWGYAKRVAELAAEFFPNHARLNELRARLYLVTGDADEALRMLELMPVEQDSVRMLELLCRVHAGQKAAAHIDLHAWARKGSCPLDARRLLALLEHNVGDDKSAVSALRQNLMQLEDPASLRMLMAFAVMRGDDAQAEVLARRLLLRGEVGVPGGELASWLEILGVPEPERRHDPLPGNIDALAIELLGAEEMIPSLAEAFILEPDSIWARLFTRAVERALPDLEEQLEPVICLAKLWYAIGDLAEARRWINRGLQLSPLSAPLAILLGKVSKAAGGVEEAEEKSHIVEVVTRVAEAHPDFADVQALRAELTGKQAA